MVTKTVEQFKLAAVHPCLTDAEVWTILLNTSIDSEGDIDDVCNFLNKHRPKLADKLTKRLK